MPDTVEIGLGRTIRRAYHLDEIALVPTRRTRASAQVSTSWQIDAHTFDLPLVAAPSDAVVSPASAATIEKLGGLAVLDGEGLWSRYDDPAAELAAIAGDAGDLQRLYSRPVSSALLKGRVGELRAAGVRVAIRLSPQHTVELAPAVLAAGVDLLVIQGTVISAEHVVGTVGSVSSNAALNLKTFIAELDVPVIVGGASNYQTALHLMRTGAAGVIVGYGAHPGATTPGVLGIDVPMATAIVDAATARRDYLDETGGRYVHLIAYGDVRTGGDIAKSLACGADAVMLGAPLAGAADAPGRGYYWDPTAAHPMLPRSSLVEVPVHADADLGRVIDGPAGDPTGSTNLFGSLRRAMAKCGYSSVKEFQKAELLLTRPR
ncbi:MAG: GuaB3 family IMP dehydrogenase-related protein [Actinomycetota bacterium]|nr:GuaB3 family IMP dehydrogenase-related protein [Actinomycetota bacterium]